MKAKESWWWDGEAQKAIKEKQTYFKNCKRDKNEENNSKYYFAEKVVSEANFKCESLYINRIQKGNLYIYTHTH